MKPQNLAKPQNSAARIEPLSVLPVFFNLHGKSVLVIGASEGALWKAELLLQAGARVTLVVEELTSEVLQLADVFSSLRLQLSRWRAADLADAVMIIADLPEGEVSELTQLARAAGALLNVIDKPEYCQFQFGSIVNKSPLVVGISTGGAAPVLAQMVRGLVEAALPGSLQSLAKTAQRIRSRVNARLDTAAKRRTYWNAFFGRAHRSQITRQPGTLPYVIDKSNCDDLSLRDLRMLRQTDAIYFAEGSNLKIGAFARREARRVRVCGSECPAAIPPTSVFVSGSAPENSARVSA